MQPLVCTCSLTCSPWQWLSLTMCHGMSWLSWGLTMTWCNQWISTTIAFADTVFVPMSWDRRRQQKLVAKRVKLSNPQGHWPCCLVLLVGTKFWGWSFDNAMRCSLYCSFCRCVSLVMVAAAARAFSNKARIHVGKCRLSCIVTAGAATFLSRPKNARQNASVRGLRQFKLWCVKGGWASSFLPIRVESMWRDAVDRNVTQVSRDWSLHRRFTRASSASVAKKGTGGTGPPCRPTVLIIVFRAADQNNWFYSG